MKTTSTLFTHLTKTLLVLGVFSITTFITYGAMSISEWALKSTPYINKNSEADKKLNRLTNGAGASILDEVVAKVKAKAIEKGGNPVNNTQYNAYLDTYLKLVDELDDTTKIEAGSDYAFIFQYIYPRVNALKKNDSRIGAIFGQLGNMVTSSGSTSNTGSTSNNGSCGELGFLDELLGDSTCDTSITTTGSTTTNTGSSDDIDDTFFDDLLGGSTSTTNTSTTNTSTTNTTAESIKQMYRDYLGREAEVAGIDYWVKEAQTTDIEAVRWNIANSPEAKLRGTTSTESTTESSGDLNFLDWLLN